MIPTGAAAGISHILAALLALFPASKVRGGLGGAPMATKVAAASSKTDSRVKERETIMITVVRLVEVEVEAEV